MKVRLCRRCEAKLVWKPDREGRRSVSPEGSEEEAAHRKAKVSRTLKEEDEDRTFRRRERDSDRSARHHDRDEGVRDTQRREYRGDRLGKSARDTNHRYSRSPSRDGGRRLV